MTNEKITVKNVPVGSFFKVRYRDGFASFQMTEGHIAVCKGYAMNLETIEAIKEPFPKNYFFTGDKYKFRARLFVTIYEPPF